MSFWFPEIAQKTGALCERNIRFELAILEDRAEELSCVNICCVAEAHIPCADRSMGPPDTMRAVEAFRTDPVSPMGTDRTDRETILGCRRN